MKKTKEEKVKETKIEKDGSYGTFLLLAMSVINILLGVVMLFVKQIELKTLCYIFIALLMIYGIGMIIRYLMMESYKNINQYGLSYGALLVTLGACALVRVDQVSSFFFLGLGIWLLVVGIIELQYALDLKALNDHTWLFLLIVSAIISVCAVVVIINPFQQDTYHTYFTYIMLIVDGVISLLSTAYLSLRLKKYHKLSEKRKKEQEEMFALARRMEAEPHHEENEMEELPEDSLGADEVQSEINEEELESLYINMDFLGLNLAQVPTKSSDWKAYIIPILYVIVSIISLK